MTTNCLYKPLAFVLAGLFSLPLVSCTTDQYGNTAVTPGGAAAIGVGAAVAGAAIGAALKDDNKKHHHHHHSRPGPPPRPPHHHHYAPRPRPHYR